MELAVAAIFGEATSGSLGFFFHRLSTFRKKTSTNVFAIRQQSFRREFGFSDDLCVRIFPIRILHARRFDPFNKNLTRNGLLLRHVFGPFPGRDRGDKMEQNTEADAQKDPGPKT